MALINTVLYFLILTMRKMLIISLFDINLHFIELSEGLVL